MCRILRARGELNRCASVGVGIGAGRRVEREHAISVGNGQRSALDGRLRRTVND